MPTYQRHVRLDDQNQVGAVWAIPDTFQQRQAAEAGVGRDGPGDSGMDPSSGKARLNFLFIPGSVIIDIYCRKNIA